MTTRILMLVAVIAATPLTAQVDPPEDSVQAANRKIACDTRLPIMERFGANLRLTRDSLEMVGLDGARPGYLETVVRLQLRYDLAKCRPTPADFMNQVAFGTVEARLLFDRGCPSESEWSSRALDLLEDQAETNIIARVNLVRAIGRVMDCPQADQDRMRDWAVRWVDLDLPRFHGRLVLGVDGV